MIAEEVVALISDPTRRHEFVLLFDVTNGNPNGDPDASNLPRVDPETGLGIVTDVAIKRKIRDYLALTQDMPIFIQSRVALNTLKRKAAEALDEPLTDDERKGKRPIPRLQWKLCQEYFDIRMFGAVLATGEEGDRLNAGQVRGPVQITFARSIDRVTASDIGISRQARTTEERMQTGTTELGRKAFVPYGLYRAHGFFNPFLAAKTGVSSEDLTALWQALRDLFTFDRSASRGDLEVRGLYVFSHSSGLGNAPTHQLFPLIDVSPTGGAPRNFSEYTVIVHEDKVPPGVTLTRLVG